MIRELRNVVLKIFERVQSFLRSKSGASVFVFLNEFAFIGFFVGLVADEKSLWKPFGIAAIFVFALSKIFDQTEYRFTFSRRDLAFPLIIFFAFFLLLLASWLQVYFDVSDAVYIKRNIKNFLRIFCVVASLCAVSQRNWSRALLVLSGVLFVFCVAEYVHIGARVRLGDNPNTVSVIGFVLLFPSLYFWLRERNVRGAFATFFCASVVAFGAARGILLGVTTGLLVLFLFLRGIDKLRVTFCAIVLVGISLLPSLGLSRFIPNNSRSPVSLASQVNTYSSGRLPLYKGAWQCIVDSNLIFGAGGEISDFSDIPFFRDAIKANRTCCHPHNIFLAYWLKFGVLGLLARIMLSSAGIVWGVLILKNKNAVSSDTKLAAKMAVSLSCAYPCIGMFDLPLWLGYLERAYVVALSLFFINGILQKRTVLSDRE